MRIEGSTRGRVVVCLLLAWTAAATASDDLRERRRIRAEPPAWRKALEAPELALDALAWPVKRSLIWAERVNLPARVRDSFYFDEERTAGWFPNFELGGEIGPAAGLKLFHENLRGRGEEIRLTTLVGFDTFREPGVEEEQVRFLFASPARRKAYAVRIEVFASEDQDEDLFVEEAADGTFRFGHETEEGDERTYAFDQARGHFRLGIHPEDDLFLGATFDPIFADVDRGDGGEPPIPSEIDGVGGPFVLLGGGPVLEWDGRDSDFRPRRGGLLRARGGYWRSVEGVRSDERPFRYFRYGGEAQAHVPTFRKDRTLAFRVALDRVEPEGDGRVPFWDLAVLDQDHSLRAFERNRFRDRGAVVASVEYRYPIWRLWDAYLFLDEGQVFRKYRDLDLDRFEWSSGAGVRFYSSKGFLLRAQYAVSEEDRNFRLGLTQEF